MITKSSSRSIDLVNSVEKSLIKNQLIKKRDKILFSISGGQDSICLLAILNQLSAQVDFYTGLIWCHHLWQVDSFLLMRQITKISYLFKKNIYLAIATKPIPSELLARNWRHNCSSRISFFYKYNKISLAHSANDKAETILLNLMRGTGVAGLSPLLWKKKDHKKKKRVSHFIFFTIFLFMWSPFFVLPNEKNQKSRKRAKCLIKRLKKINAVLFYRLGSRCTSSFILLSITTILNFTGDTTQTKGCILTYDNFQKKNNARNSCKENWCNKRLQKKEFWYNGKFQRKRFPIVSTLFPLVVPGAQPVKRLPCVSRDVHGVHQFLSSYINIVDESMKGIHTIYKPCAVCDNRKKVQLITNVLHSKIVDPIVMEMQTNLNHRDYTQQNLLSGKSSDFVDEISWVVEKVVLKKYKKYKLKKKSKICKKIKSKPWFYFVSYTFFKVCPMSLGQLEKKKKVYFNGVVPSSQCFSQSLQSLQPVKSLVKSLQPAQPKVGLKSLQPVQPGVITVAMIALISPMVAQISNKPLVEKITQISNQKPFVVQALTKGRSQFVKKEKKGIKNKLQLMNYWQGSSQESRADFISEKENSSTIRPLLSLNRFDISKLCFFWQLPVYPDKSNQKLNFLRNRVRKQLIPLIKFFFNVRIEHVLLQFAEIFSAEDSYMSQISTKFFKKLNKTECVCIFDTQNMQQPQFFLSSFILPQRQNNKIGFNHSICCTICACDLRSQAQITYKDCNNWLCSDMNFGCTIKDWKKQHQLFSLKSVVKSLVKSVQSVQPKVVLIAMISPQIPNQPILLPSHPEGKDQVAKISSLTTLFEIKDFTTNCFHQIWFCVNYVHAHDTEGNGSNPSASKSYFVLSVSCEKKVTQSLVSHKKKSYYHRGSTIHKSLFFALKNQFSLSGNRIENETNFFLLLVKSVHSKIAKDLSMVGVSDSWSKPKVISEPVLLQKSLEWKRIETFFDCGRFKSIDEIDDKSLQQKNTVVEGEFFSYSLRFLKVSIFSIKHKTGKLFIQPRSMTCVNRVQSINNNYNDFSLFCNHYKHCNFVVPNFCPSYASYVNSVDVQQLMQNATCKTMCIFDPCPKGMRSLGASVQPKVFVYPCSSHPEGKRVHQRSQDAQSDSQNTKVANGRERGLFVQFFGFIQPWQPLPKKQKILAKKMYVSPLHQKTEIETHVKNSISFPLLSVLLNQKKMKTVLLRLVEKEKRNQMRKLLKNTFGCNYVNQEDIIFSHLYDNFFVMNYVDHQKLIFNLSWTNSEFIKNAAPFCLKSVQSVQPKVAMIAIISSGSINLKIGDSYNFFNLYNQRLYRLQQLQKSGITALSSLTTISRFSVPVGATFWIWNRKLCWGRRKKGYSRNGVTLLSTFNKEFSTFQPSNGFNTVLQTHGNSNIGKLRNSHKIEKSNNKEKLFLNFDKLGQDKKEIYWPLIISFLPSAIQRRFIKLFLADRNLKQIQYSQIEQFLTVLKKFYSL